MYIFSINDRPVDGPSVYGWNMLSVLVWVVQQYQVCKWKPVSVYNCKQYLSRFQTFTISECCILSFGWFPIIWILYTNRVFQNVGILNSDTRDQPKERIQYLSILNQCAGPCSFSWNHNFLNCNDRGRTSSVKAGR